MDGIDLDRDPPGQTALEQAAAQFAAEGVPFPDIPATLAGRLRRRAEWWYDTRPEGAPPYALDSYVQAFIDRGRGTGESPADYVVLAHDGHGASSWALHFYLVVGPVAAFVQSSWGGATTDDDTDALERARMADRFLGVRDLFAAANDAGTRLGDRRVCVVVSDMGPKRWAVLEDGQPVGWQDEPDPLAAARRWLVAQGTQTRSTVG